jgi:hypothetical protein
MIALSVSRLVALLLIGVVSIFVVPSVCSGHGGVSLENDLCILRVGPYTMHFTGYQPQVAPEVEFCEDITYTGPTLIVLDYLDSALRQLPVETRIIRDTGDESDLARITVYHQPATLHPRGTFVIEHTFPEPGQFVGIVTVGEHVSRFPFAVGTGGWRTIVLYAVFAALALGVGGLLFFYSSRRA